MPSPLLAYSDWSILLYHRIRSSLGSHLKDGTEMKILTLGMLAGLVALVACNRPSEEKKVERKGQHMDGEVKISAEAQAKFGFATARPQRVAPVRLIEATAAIAPDPARVVHIAPIAKGRIERVQVQVGDSVSQGAPLFEYDNIELGEAIGDYMAELADLQRDLAQLEFARKAWERARLLLEKGIIARKEVEVQEAAHRAADAAVANRRARIGRIEEKLHRFGMTEEQHKALAADHGASIHREASHTPVRAPIAGVVIMREGAPGEVVGPEKALLSIADLSMVWTLVDIYEKDLAQIRRGAPVEITVEAYPGETFRGTIAYVADLLDPETRTAKARVEIPNPQRKLKPGMFATVRLRVSAPASAAHVFAVPSSAVQQVDGEASVFVRRDPVIFQRQKVRLGMAIGNLVEVTEGLSGNEEVVTTGSFSLKSELLKERIGKGN